MQVQEVAPLHDPLKSARRQRRPPKQSLWYKHGSKLYPFGLGRFSFGCSGVEYVFLLLWRSARYVRLAMDWSMSLKNLAGISFWTAARDMYPFLLLTIDGTDWHGSRRTMKTSEKENRPGISDAVALCWAWKCKWRQKPSRSGATRSSLFRVRTKSS